MKIQIFFVLLFCVVLTFCQTTQKSSSSSSNSGGDTGEAKGTNGVGKSTTSSSSTSTSTSKTTKGGKTIETNNISKSDGKDKENKIADQKNAQIKKNEYFDDGNYYKGDDGHYLNGKFHNDDLAQKKSFDIIDTSSNRGGNNFKNDWFKGRNSFDGFSDDWRNNLHDNGNFGNIGFQDDRFDRQNDFFDEYQ